MKFTRKISYVNVVIVAFLAELLLIGIQFAFLNIYAMQDPGFEPAFTEEYMKSRGFFIFQILGFFGYVVITVNLARKIKVGLFNKILAMVIAGGIFELSFYLLIQAQYEIAYFYSILDKFVGSIMGLIVFYVIRKPGVSSSAGESSKANQV